MIEYDDPSIAIPIKYVPENTHYSNDINNEHNENDNQSSSDDGSISDDSLTANEVYERESILSSNDEDYEDADYYIPDSTLNRIIKSDELGEGGRVKINQDEIINDALELNKSEFNIEDFKKYVEGYMKLKAGTLSDKDAQEAQIDSFAVDDIIFSNNDEVAIQHLTRPY